MNKDTHEILTILIEEAAEVIQEASKIKRFGLNPDNINRFTNEFAQLVTMFNMLQDVEPSVRKTYQARNFDAKIDKCSKLKQYSEIEHELLDDVINEVKVSKNVEHLLAVYKEDSID